MNIVRIAELPTQFVSTASTRYNIAKEKLKKNGQFHTEFHISFFETIGWDIFQDIRLSLPFDVVTLKYKFVSTQMQPKVEPSSLAVLFYRTIFSMLPSKGQAEEEEEAVS